MNGGSSGGIGSRVWHLFGTAAWRRGGFRFAVEFPRQAGFQAEALSAPRQAGAPVACLAAAAMVSVIIPVRNERGFIAACLDSVLASDYPGERLEILVVDGSSEDGTPAIAESYAARYANVRLLENPKKVTPAGLNVGIAAAAGAIVVRLDAHARIDASYLSRCVAWLESSGAANVGGVLRTLPRQSGTVAEAIALALSHPFGVGNSAFRTAARQATPEPPVTQQQRLNPRHINPHQINPSQAEPRWVDTVFGGCYHREVFEHIGGFNERLSRGQDLEFNLRLKRAGGRTLLVPAIRCDYFARSDWRSFWRHNFTNGVWAIRPFLESDVVPVRPRHLVPLLFVLAIGACIAAASWGRGAAPLAGLAAVYCTLALVAAVQAGWRSGRWRPAVLLPGLFLGLHVAYGLGSVWGMAGVIGETAARAVRRLRETSARAGPASSPVE